MRDKFGVIVLAVFNPAGRAGGNHRQNAAVLEPLQKFVRFFDNRKVRGEVGVKYLVEAQTAQRGNHFAFDVGADMHTERLAERCANGRRGVDNDKFFGVIDCGEHLVGVVFFNNRAGRAVDDALTAGNARHVGKVFVERRADVRVKAAGVCADNGNALRVAGGNTAAAKNAFVVVTHHVRGGVVEIIVNGLAGKCIFVVYAEFLAKCLQFAGPASNTRKTALVVRGKNQLERRFTGMAHLFGVGKDFHAFAYRVHTGGDQVSRAFHFDHANAAGADFVNIF